MLAGSALGVSCSARRLCIDAPPPPALLGRGRSGGGGVRAEPRCLRRPAPSSVRLPARGDPSRRESPLLPAPADPRDRQPNRAAPAPPSPLTARGWRTLPAAEPAAPRGRPRCGAGPRRGGSGRGREGRKRRREDPAAPPPPPPAGLPLRLARSGAEEGNPPAGGGLASPVPPAAGEGAASPPCSAEPPCRGLRAPAGLDRAPPTGVPPPQPSAVATATASPRGTPSNGDGGAVLGGGRGCRLSPAPSVPHPGRGTATAAPGRCSRAGQRHSQNGGAAGRHRGGAGAELPLKSVTWCLFCVSISWGVGGARFFYH